MPEDLDPKSVCANLIEGMHSLQLSTVGPDGIPHCGYTPYLYRTPNSFYIFVSQLAAHTHHLLANSQFVRQTGKHRERYGYRKAPWKSSWDTQNLQGQANDESLLPGSLHIQ